MDMGFFVTPDLLQMKVMPWSLNPGLVLLSYIIASAASFTALLLATRMRAADDSRQRRQLLAKGAVSMGGGIWSMHFVGMLAVRMPAEVSYDAFLTALSLVIAVLVAGYAFFLVQAREISRLRLISSGILMGIGVACMHYTGMAAMRMDALIRYRPGIFSLSIVIAVIAATAALWLLLYLQEDEESKLTKPLLISSLVMGLAVSGMHYTGMFATVFIDVSEAHSVPPETLVIVLLVFSVTTLIALTLSFALITSYIQKIAVKTLLILSLAIGIGAILTLSIASFASNKWLSSNQGDLINTLLPLQSANRLISVATSDFIERQRGFLSARSVAELKEHEDRAQLESAFMRERNLLGQYSGTVPRVGEVLKSIDEAYTSFLSADQKLFQDRESVLATDEQLLRQIRVLDREVADVKRITGGIAGKINLSLKRLKRRIRKATNDPERSGELNGLLLRATSGSQADIQQENYSIQAGVASLAAISRQMILERNSDLLRSIKSNQAEQAIGSTFNALDSLKEHLEASPALLRQAEDLDTHLHNLWSIMAIGDDSLYALQMRSISWEDDLELRRQVMDTAVSSISQSLDELSYLVSEMKHSASRRSSQVAETSSVAVFILSIGALSLFVFIGMAILREVYSSSEKLRAAKSQAEEATRAKSNFLANVSHELRTPMNHIMGYVDIVLGSDIDATQKGFLKKARSSSNDLLTIINNIISFSQMDKNELSIEAVDFWLDDVLQDLVASFSEQADKKGLKLELAGDEALPMGLVGDPQRLSEILTNLIDNAIKFTEAGGVTVERRLSHQDKNGLTLQFTVRDTGIGISEEKMPGLFEAFTQGDASSTRTYGGTGVGLAISKSLVTLMGGEIWVESTPGNGSSFHFTAELKVSSTAQSERAASPSVESGIGDSRDTEEELISDGQADQDAKSDLDIEAVRGLLVGLPGLLEADLIEAMNQLATIRPYFENTAHWGAFVTLEGHIEGFDTDSALQSLRSICDTLGVELG